jgi:translation initiation factor 2B subunit (eIF-2B alpha/beta/delta family)
MAPIANLVSLFVCRFASAADNGTEPADIKKLARDSANRILADGQKARQAVCRHAAEIITSRSIILTCSYSSTICRALALAREKGLDFKVLAARSQLPEAGMAYGDITAAELDKWGIDCQVAAEEILTTQPPAVNLFLIGADAIMMDGSLTNGYPSLCLARAFQHRVPLYALAETSKINPQGLMAAEPGFDLIPAGLITGIISEQGIIPAAAIKTCGQQWKQYRDMAADILAGFMRV